MSSTTRRVQSSFFDNEEGGRMRTTVYTNAERRVYGKTSRRHLPKADRFSLGAPSKADFGEKSGSQMHLIYRGRYTAV